MNILFLTNDEIGDYNSQGIFLDLMKEFSINHKVYIVCSNERKKKQKTHLFKKNNLNILRVKTGNITQVNFIEKGLSTLLINRYFRKAINKHLFNIKFDLIIYSTPPITLYNVIKNLKKKHKAKTYLLLKDIFPQNAVDLKLFSKRSLIYKYFRRIEKKYYDISDYIGTMSIANTNYLLKHNNMINPTNVELNPNTITPLNYHYDTNKKNEIREKYGIPLDKTVYVYGGNLGKPQGINFIINVLKVNEKIDDSFILIIGSGTEYKSLKNQFDEHNMMNSQIMSKIPKNEYEILVNTCDVGLIFLDHRFTIPNFPSRLLSYMQASIPVLAATDPNTDIGKVIEENNFGFSCQSNDVEKFIRLLEKLKKQELRFKLGKKGREYLEENYTSKKSYEVIMKHFNN